VTTGFLNVVQEMIATGERPAGGPSCSLRVRYLTAAIWSIAGLGIGRGATFVASMFTARLLGAEAFGGFAIVQSTVSIAATLAGAGLGVTASRHVAEFRVRDPQRAGRILGLSAAVAVISGAILALATIASAPFADGSAADCVSASAVYRPQWLSDRRSRRA
jgi:O-antigen/teichoic acid export membrane protein